MLLGASALPAAASRSQTSLSHVLQSSPHAPLIREKATLKYTSPHGPSSHFINKKFTQQPIVPITQSNSSNTPTTNTTKIELCLDCIEFMDNNLQNLENIIDKIGVTDTCEKICSLLNSSIDVDMCNTMCDAIGSEKFWQLILSAGINPIYACEMVNACSTNPFPAVSFTASTITPANGPIGTTFVFKIQFNVINETGVGETAFVIYYPSGSDHELGFISQQIFADYTPGTYEASLTFPTNTSFNTGEYLLMFDLCSGACGQDPDPYPFASEELTFNITSS